jgi:surface antigen
MRNDNHPLAPIGLDAIRLVALACLPALLAACFGGGGAPPTVSVDKSARTASQTAAAATIDSATDLSVDGVPMLEVFRKNPVGKELDRVDDVYAERSAQLALEYDQDGVARGWTNPETGTTGAVKPVRTFKRTETYCREYEQTLQVRERGSKDVKAQAEAKGQVACREPDGKWKFLP